MTTEAMFEMLHGMAVDALERMEAERDSLRARAEAAERRAEAAEAEAERLRAELAAMPRPEDRCHGAWPCEASTALASAEAEAARWEARAEALAAELAQARADARVLAGLAYGLQDCCWVEEGLAPAGLTDAEADALDDAYDAAGRLSDAEVVAVIRRALGGAA